MHAHLHAFPMPQCSGVCARACTCCKFVSHSCCPALQVGYFLVEDAVARTAGWAGAAGAEGHLDIVAQVLVVGRGEAGRCRALPLGSSRISQLRAASCARACPGPQLQRQAQRGVAPATVPTHRPLHPFRPLHQVDAAWDAAVAALKAVLEPAFRGATAAAAMLTVKDFLLLVCLALGEHSGGGRASPVS